MYTFSIENMSTFYSAVRYSSKKAMTVFPPSYLLSTCRNRMVAYTFAESIHIKSDLIVVLFELSIDTSISSFTFAYLCGAGRFH